MKTNRYRKNEGRQFVSPKNLNLRFEMILKTKRVLNLITDPNQEVSWSLVSDSMEKLTFPLEYSWGIVNHLNGVKNHEALRQSHQKVQPSVVTLASKLAQSRPYYNAMKVSPTYKFWVYIWMTIG